MDGFPADFICTDPVPIPRHVFIVAEIGINHNGSIDIAKQLIEVARSAGCDAVKFQKRDPEVCVPARWRNEPRSTPWGEMTYLQYRRRVEFGIAEYDQIDAYCRSLGIEWFASAWDTRSLQFLRRYNTKYNKVASAMTTNIEFVDEVATERKITFVSTGMCSYADIDRAVAAFKAHNCPVVLMHSVSTYPAPDIDLNLLGLHALRKRYGLPVGYSGHEPSVSPSVMACVLGAVAIERHITLDRAMFGTDQAASLEKPGLETLVSQIRKIPIVIGDGVKRVTEDEKALAGKLRYWMPVA